MITAVIVHINQLGHLKKCIESLRDFADEIIVVDIGSSKEIKAEIDTLKVKVFEHSSVSYVEPIRNFAISKASYEWVVVLDPDEMMSDGLKKVLNQVDREKYVAVNIPRKNIFFDKWISHTNWWPDRHIRFFNKEKVKWSEKIHSYPTVSGKVLNLPAKGDNAIEHFGYTNISEFILRQNRYSTVDALNRFDAGERFSWKNFLWRPIREFLARYIKHQGYLDGKYGFSLVVLMMIYQIIVEVKLWEMQKKS